MSFSIHGLAVSRGIAIGRAVLVASSRVDVAHYFVRAEEVEAEIARVRDARNAVVEELQRLQHDLPADAPQELGAMLDVHLMLLQDKDLELGVRHWITERLYNAEWALTTQLEVIRGSSTRWKTPTCASASPTSSRWSSGCCATCAAA